MIKINNKDTSAIYLGSTSISKVYKGDTLVWEKRKKVQEINGFKEEDVNSGGSPGGRYYLRRWYKFDVEVSPPDAVLDNIAWSVSTVYYNSTNRAYKTLNTYPITSSTTESFSDRGCSYGYSCDEWATFEAYLTNNGKSLMLRNTRPNTVITRSLILEVNIEIIGTEIKFTKRIGYDSI